MAKEESAFIVHKIWEEISQINMHKINRRCRQNLMIALVGSPGAVKGMLDWLSNYPVGSWLSNIMPEIKPHLVRREMMKRLTLVTAAAPQDIDSDLLHHANFCLADPLYAEEVKKHHDEVYLFDAGDPQLASQIIDNNGKLRFALSHNFPVFRPDHAKIEIQDTALQNAAWVMLSAFPTLLPSARTGLLTTIENISDVVVLTLNEIKLLFELLGVLGERIHLKTAIEVLLVIGLAKLARTIATVLANCVPTRYAIIGKAAMAYALTWGVGEMIVLYIAARQKQSYAFLLARTRQHLRDGLRAATGLVQ